MEDLYFPPSLRHFEPLRVLPQAALDHMCFEYDLVEALRPRLVVDLGAGDASSFFVFCQALRDHDVDGVCFAVDEWSDDEHKTEEDETHTLAINHHARSYYRGIAYLCKLSPAQALAHFADATVDLLRIDAQRLSLPLDQLIAAWLPRVAPAGALICPGVGAPDSELGRAWEGATRGRDTFTFRGGGGLGVLRPDPAAREARPQLLALLGSSDPHDRRDLERYYAHAAEHHALRRALRPIRFNIGRKKTKDSG